MAKMLRGVVPKSLGKTGSMKNAACAFAHMADLPFDDTIGLGPSRRRRRVGDTQRARHGGKLWRRIRVKQHAFGTVQEVSHSHGG